MLEKMIGTFGEITYYHYALDDFDAMFQNIERSRAKSLFENLVFTERKIPLNLNCIKYKYDITEQQPQLFVTPSYKHLSKVLKILSKKMSNKKGGLYGIKNAY